MGTTDYSGCLDAMENVNPIEFAMNFHSNFVESVVTLCDCDCDCFFLGKMNRPRSSLTLTMIQYYYIYIYTWCLVIASVRQLEVDHISYSLLIISILIYSGWCAFFFPSLFSSCFHRTTWSRTAKASQTFHKINPICNLICDISEPKKDSSGNGKLLCNCHHYYIHVCDARV